MPYFIEGEIRLAYRKNPLRFTRQIEATNDQAALEIANRTAHKIRTKPRKDKKVLAVTLKVSYHEQRKLGSIILDKETLPLFEIWFRHFRKRKFGLTLEQARAKANETLLVFIE